MRSRIDNHWIILGVAALLMVAVPWILLSRQPEAPLEKPPLVITKVKPQDIVNADMALQKPVFNPERSPLTAAEKMMASREIDPAMPEEAAQQAPAPTLVGVVSKRHGKAVAIVKGQDGSSQTLSPGQNIDGWRLVRVGKSSARFASNNGPVDVNLDFSNKAIGGPNTPPQTDPAESSVE